MTVEQLSTSKISSTCPTGVNYISKYAGDLREKSHEVWTWNSNRSRCTAKKTTGGGQNAPPPPNGIRVKSIISRLLWLLNLSASMLHALHWPVSITLQVQVYIGVYGLSCLFNNINNKEMDTLWYSHKYSSYKVQSTFWCISYCFILHMKSESFVFD